MERIYRLDQEILNARGIALTVAEVVGLSTAEYAAKLRRLNLTLHDAAFVKSLRRRIKNRMASQNSRRRTAEHMRSLAAQLRAVRASKGDILRQRSELLRCRAALTARCQLLATYLAQKLLERGDSAVLPAVEVSSTALTPDISDPERDDVHPANEHIYEYDRGRSLLDDDTILDFRKCPITRNSLEEEIKDIRIKEETITRVEANHDISIEENIKNEKEEVAKALELLTEYKVKTEYKMPDIKADPDEAPRVHRTRCFPVEYEFNEIDRNIESKSYNIIKCNEEDFSEEIGRKRKKAVKKRSGCILHTSQVQYETCFSNKNVYLCAEGDVKSEVLNLSVKTAPASARERRHHGRKQTAPRRVTCVPVDDDLVLDLKVKRSLE